MEMKIRFKDPMNFKRQLLIKGYSLRSFAIEAGMSNGYLSLMLREERHPSPGIAQKILAVIGAEFEDIFFIEDVHQSKQE
ncbi:helix-turn-helix domain-containing protein [Mesobacillus subterraneus]|uniref:helix-turn-helix domain-containing protein n=1 Tax=Mesobacillus subterraneus TaxID=285983 RepID=UPI00203B6830|nr:helix-turn-helix transcriptional regulator [Mesobacillus subterraneus]MCM3573331.1 helix-turn-helix domain-containing protein [Mesobacillus subterraneus]